MIIPPAVATWSYFSSYQSIYFCNFKYRGVTKKITLLINCF